MTTTKPTPGRRTWTRTWSPFFLLRRNLDYLVDWLGAVLTGDQPAEQAHADLEGGRWCLSRWAVLEARIDHARLLLARRQRSG